MNKRVCIISRYFFPTISPAANRINAFAKYLSEVGYHVDVFSIGGCKAPISDFRGKVLEVADAFFLREPDFSKKCPKIIHWLKVIWKLLVKRLSYCFPQWEKQVLRKMISMGYTYDIVISSFCPESPHRIANQYKQIYPGSIWIADMRDEFLQNIALSYGVKAKREDLLKSIYANADLITTVSEPIARQFKSSHLPVEVIYNGFDFSVGDEWSSSSIFRIGYAGSMYGGSKPHLFWEAIQSLLDERVIDKERLKIDFVGTVNIDIPDSLKRFVTVHDKRPYSEVAAFLKNCNLLLLVLEKSKRQGVYSAKLFDYLGARRPILAIVDPSDVAAQLVKSLGAGYVADFSSKEDIKENLAAAYDDWEQGILRVASKKDVLQYQRKEQVKKLVGVITKLESLHD